MMTDWMRVEVSVPPALLFRFLEQGTQTKDDERVLWLLKQAANIPLKDVPPKKLKTLVRRCQRAEQAVLALFRDVHGSQYIDGAVMGHAILLWVSEAIAQGFLVTEEGDWMELSINYLSDELKPHWRRAERYAPEFVPLIWDVLREQGLYCR